MIAQISSNFICQPTSVCRNSVKLGYFAENKTVSSNVTRIDASTTEMTYLKKIGIDVHRDSSASYEPFYYYNVDPSIGEITKMQEARNDISSLLYVIKRAENRYDRSFDSTSAQKKLDISNYIRSFNKQYGTSGGYGNFIEWSTICGNINTAFNYANDYQSLAGLYDYQYLSNLVEPQFYNEVPVYPTDAGLMYSLGHPSVPLGESSIKKTIINPFLTTNGIDLTHMFAVVSDYLTSNAIKSLNKYLYSLGSWGGDLQTLCASLSDSNTCSFDSLLENGNGYFSYEDLNADVDGENIAYYDIMNCSNQSNLSYSINEYYQNVQSEGDRMRLFVQNAVRTGWLDGSNDIDKFQKCVYDLLHLTFNNNGSIVESNEAFSSVNPKFRLFFSVSSFNGSLQSLDLRKSLADSFCNYFARYFYVC